MPTWIITALSLISAAATGAPQMAQLITSARDFFGGLFAAGQISVAQQAAISARLETITQAVLKGEVPPAWQVEPDPE